MDAADAGRHLGREHERLAQAAAAVGRRVAQEVAPPGAQQGSQPGIAELAQQGREHAQRRVPQILGQVEDGRRIARWRSWTRRSVGWRSETMWTGRPRRSSARISWAMNVSESRG